MAEDELAGRSLVLGTARLMIEQGLFTTTLEEQVTALEAGGQTVSWLGEIAPDLRENPPGAGLGIHL